MSAEGHRPICQDTGIAVVFLKVGMKVQWDATLSVQEMVNEGVRRAYGNPTTRCAPRCWPIPAGTRKNTKDNTPAVVHYEIVPGDHVEVICAAKGGGSEAKAKFAMLNPSDDLVDWVLKTVPTMGAGWCPPGILGIGIGGTPEKAMLLAKEALMAPVDIQELKARGRGVKTTRAEELRLELLRKGQCAGHRRAGPRRPDHGARRQGARLPDACRQPAGGADPQLRRDAPLPLSPRRLRPGQAAAAQARRLAQGDLAGRHQVRHARRPRHLTKAEVAAWKPGQTCCSTARCSPAATPPTSASPTCWPRARSCRSTSPTASSTTSARSIRCATKWSARPAPPPPRAWTSSPSMMLEQTGLIGMVGKAERGPAAIEAIKDNKSAYLMAVGGAAYLVAKAIKSAKVVGFADLGMEAIYEFDVKDMPVTVAVDSQGTSVHITGPKEWQAKIGKIPVRTSVLSPTLGVTGRIAKP
jgi:fumarate hydratase class I